MMPSHENGPHVVDYAGVKPARRPWTVKTIRNVLVFAAATLLLPGFVALNYMLFEERLRWRDLSPAIEWTVYLETAAALALGVGAAVMRSSLSPGRRQVAAGCCWLGGLILVGGLGAAAGSGGLAQLISWRLSPPFLALIAGGFSVQVFCLVGVVSQLRRVPADAG